MRQTRQRQGSLLIVKPPARDKETRELIERFKAKRKRRRTLRIAYASLGGVVLLALVITVVLLLTRGPAGEAGAGAIADATSSSASVTAAPASGATTAATGQTAGTSQSTTTAPPSGSTSEVTTAMSSTTLPSTTFATTCLHHAASDNLDQPRDLDHDPATERLAASGLVVCIDPGHQAHGDSSLEPVGPGSSDMKAKVSDGTAGTVTGTPESQLVLAVSLKLRDALVSNGHHRWS